MGLGADPPFKDPSVVEATQGDWDVGEPANAIQACGVQTDLGVERYPSSL